MVARTGRCSATYRAGDYASARAGRGRPGAPRIRKSASMPRPAGDDLARRPQPRRPADGNRRHLPSFSVNTRTGRTAGMPWLGCGARWRKPERRGLLDAAAEALPRGENDRLVAALVALADTWSRYNEWRSRPRGSAFQAEGYRSTRRVREQIARGRVTALPDSTAGLANRSAHCPGLTARRRYRTRWPTTPGTACGRYRIDAASRRGHDGPGRAQAERRWPTPPSYTSV